MPRSSHLLRRGAATTQAIENRIAVAFQEQTLNYAQLEARAGAVAAGIQVQGHTAPIVGLSLQRGPNAIVALLAILKAGGTCVPVDPDHSETYQTALFAKARCTLVISDRDLTGLHCPSISVEGLESADPAIAREVCENDVGFILFTSGTTGNPKGVILGLDALTAAAESFAQRVEITGASVIAQYAGLSFDAAILEFLLAYIHKARLEIISSHARVEPETLAQSLVDQAVTHIILPAAIVPYLPLRKDYALQALICVGDVLEDRIFHDWARHYPTFNGYGPTESSICTSLHKVTPDEPITLGVPLAHVTMAMGGENGSELLVSGPGLAQGYLDEPALTGEKFRADVDGTIWYHTGDLVTDAGNGRYRFAGRNDFQVKINGARVETGAIESALKAVPGIDDAAVIACGDANSGRFLAAFIASSAPQKTILPIAQHHIGNAFPASHMPNVFRFLDRLPMTVNQKVDRRKLADTLPLEHSSTDPVHAVFCAELKIDNCAVDDNFFRLGGSSIGAMRLLAKLAHKVGRHLPVKAFRASPTIAGLHAMIAQNQQDSMTITKGQRTTDILPLSPQQNAAWYMFLQDPFSKAYLAEAVHYFESPLDVAALEGALQHVIDRHEIYRTVFFEQDGVPVQKVLPSTRAVIRQISAEHIAPNDKDAFLRQILHEEMPGITDLGKLPLANFVLVSFGPKDHAFIHQEHHIIHDGWGGSAFTAELLNWYHNLTSDSFGFVPEAPAQYADFLLTQDAWLKSAEAGAQLEYWREQLHGAPQSVAIFGKKSQTPGFQGDFCRLDFTRAEWSRCEDVCRRLEVTPFGFTTAVLNLLLWQYSGQTDIVIGSPFANRNWQNSQEILGMVVNTLVLRQKIDQTQSLEAFIKSTQNMVNDAYANQEYPFGALVEAINPERFNGQNPLFNVLLGFHDAPIAVTEVDGFGWRKDETVISHTSKFDLDCLVVNRKGHFAKDDIVSFLWEYRSDVYEQAEIAQFVESFRHVFLALCRDLSGTVGALSVLTPDQEKTLAIWGQGTTPSIEQNAIFGDQSFSDALCARFSGFGDRIALQTTEKSLSYDTLNQKSSAIATAIAPKIKPGDRVVVYAPRSIEQVVAMVAILKLQATIICLDPTLPEARLAHILTDCQPTLVLCGEGDTRPLAACEQVRIADALSCDGAIPHTPPASGHLAYINYTSGSTGQPKGVEVFADGLRDECLHLIATLDLSECSTSLSLSYCGFDAYHGEVWPALLAGATLVMIADAERDDLQQLSDIMQRFEVSAACFPTALLEEAFASGFAWPQSLKTLAAGGDRLGPVSRPPGFNARLYNFYGPTETTIDATFYELPADNTQVPPIGRPALNTTAKVLDGDRLCPVGGVGELVIGGTGVAKGYLNKPDETARAFVTLKGGERYYRTGDKARWRMDGQLEFLGRLDDEISLRGHRIAPAEITAALQTHEAVAQSAVALKGGALFAYVTVKDATLKTGKLSRQLMVHLKKTLPGYMRPNAVIVLERMPLTDQGKVDTKALPSPLASAERFETPINQTEESLLALWLEVLPVDKVSVTQNFFSVGGHSLLATRLIAILRDRFDVVLKINDFFELGTIRGLAERIDLIRATTSQAGDEFVSEGEF